MECVFFDFEGCCTGAVAGTCLLLFVFDVFVCLCFLDLLDEDEDDFFSTLERVLK